MSRWVSGIVCGQRCPVYWVYSTFSRPSPQVVQCCRNLPLVAELAGYFDILIQTVDSEVRCLHRPFSWLVSFFFVKIPFIRLESIFLSISHKFFHYFYACVGLCHKAATLHLRVCVCASVGTCVSNIVLPRFAWFVKNFSERAVFQSANVRKRNHIFLILYCKLYSSNTWCVQVSF